MVDCTTKSHKVEDERSVKELFMGEFNHSVDQKGRLMLPSRFREEMDGKCIVSIGYEHCLNVYTVDEWNKFAESLSRLSPHNADARRVLRKILSGANECDMDKQGRVVIPQNLREYASLGSDKTDVVVVGALTKIEIWNVDNWKEYNEGEDSISLEEAGANLAEMGV